MKWSRNKLIDILLFFESSPSSKEYHIFCALYTNFLYKKTTLVSLPLLLPFHQCSGCQQKKEVHGSCYTIGRIYVDAVDPANQMDRQIEAVDTADRIDISNS
jgi:hypothetical protein